MYLAPIESATVLSTSETAMRDHKSVPIPNNRKLIGSDSDNRVPDRNLDAFPKDIAVLLKRYTLVSHFILITNLIKQQYVVKILPRYNDNYFQLFYGNIVTSGVSI